MADSVSMKACVLKRISYILFITTLCVIGVGITSFAGAEPILRIGIYENAPKVFTDKHGQPAGFFVDIIQTIASSEGWELEYVYGSWSQGLERLEHGEIDLMPDVAYSSARARLFSFHQEAALSDWFQVYSAKGSDVKSLPDLNGKSVAVLERSVQKDAFEQLLREFGFQVEMEILPDYRSIFAMVQSGKADAAITNRFYGATHAQVFNLQDTGVIFHPTRLYFAAPQGSHGEILHILDTYLRQWKSDPDSIYYQSLRRWTSEQVELRLPDWTKIVFLSGLIFVCLAVEGNIVLKRQVNTRTRQLQQANVEMEHRVEQRTAELAQALEKAEQADRVKSAFLATMSHELRTPLNSIIGFTGIMLQGLAGPLNDEQNKQMHMVQSSARHLLGLINDVLDISKIEAGQLELSFSTFELRASIEKMLNLVQPLARDKELELRSECPVAVGTVCTDQHRLEQIILNLLTNAIKFTEQGHVEVLCAVAENGYVVKVCDTGIGIAAQDMPELFRPFHQLDSGLARKREGTGLGLSICKRLVELMGGNIQVESQSGIGSTFSIWLPSRPGAVA